MNGPDVMETESSVIASFELPGVNKDEIDVTVTDRHVEVKVQSRQEKESKEEGRYSYARMSRQFYRAVPLPAEVKPEQAKATFQNGLLRIEVPKAGKGVKGTKLRIE